MAAVEKHSIVLDVMGADSSEDEIVRGGLDAARTVGVGLHVVLVGDQQKIEKILSQIPDPPPNVSVHHAPNTVPMHISATDGARMQETSMGEGLKLIKTGKAEGFVSPGNTGAVMASALLTLGRLEDVIRPAIAAVFPSSTGRPALVLDVGANADCKPQHLSQFAVMGSVYYSVAFRHDSPRVGLLSIGEERSKGNELIFSTLKKLKGSKINFVGNIEGRDILSGHVDVAVTDGFTGNILLKFAESVKPLLVKSVQRQIQTNIFSRVGVMLLLPFLRRMRNLFDYAEAGGAPLLGVNGDVIICHGSSNARAIHNAVIMAWEMSARGIRKRIHDELITNHFGRNNDAKDKGTNNRDGIVYSAAANDQC